MLESLVRNNVVRENGGTKRTFEWKIEKVVERTNVGDNIVQLLLDRINAMSQCHTMCKQQAVIFVAAHLGFRFQIPDCCCRILVQVE